MNRVSDLGLVLDRVRTSGARVVAIDGLLGSGKSWLASQVGRKLGWNVLGLDSFVTSGPATYPEMLDIERLERSIAESTRCIVEGILVLDVLQRANITPSLHVYVRRWKSDDQLEAPDYWELTADEVVEQENELCRIMGLSDDEPILQRELAHYHRQFRPFHTADVVYENLHAG